LEIPLDSEFNLVGQLEQRCKRLPKKIPLAYFVKALGMDAQYKAVKANESVKEKTAHSFSF
jgi:hypothetical protein